MLLSTLGASLLRVLLPERSVIRVDDKVVRAGNGTKKERSFNAFSSFY